MRSTYFLGASVSVLVFAACSGDETPATFVNGDAGTGGGQATGGANATGGAVGTGGKVSTGGRVATGGALGTGGAPATGGTSNTGGSAVTGGSPNTGGAPVTGGVSGDASVTGGAPATGGAPVTGGAPATGGAPTTGGAPATGGAPVTGGAPATGGATVTGGAPATGGSAGSDGGLCTPPTSGGACDTVPQCGCVSGENCDVTFADGTTECIAAGTTLPWHACDDLGQCQAGYTCVSGACSSFCEDASAVCPGTGATCDQVYSGVDAIPGLFVCSRTCYPVNPQQEDTSWDACGPGLGCYPTPDKGSYCAGPTTPGALQYTDCFDLNGNPDNTQCAPGYFCDQDLVCKKFCLRSTPFCPSLYTCYGFSGRPMIAGSEEIGFCDF